ncbi:hypothetical protein FRC16_003095 [Serendipita sp. 398]|nr:hypothetical protein FRC16_003095 [Serendipita sp. 398]
MSFVQRKGCFKCGNLGHHAEACTSTERLCYNCRQPGHESSNCPSPRTVDRKQCYSCGGIGHVQSDCPSLKNASLHSGNTNQKCHHCGRIGHIARFCPAAARGGLGRGGAAPRAPAANATSNPIKCFRCGGLNHYSRDCMAPAGTMVEGQQLVNSGNTGGPSAKGKTCYKCREEGHVSHFAFLINPSQVLITLGAM